MCTMWSFCYICPGLWLCPELIHRERKGTFASTCACYCHTGQILLFLHFFFSLLIFFLFVLFVQNMTACLDYLLSCHIPNDCALNYWKTKSTQKCHLSQSPATTPLGRWDLQAVITHFVCWVKVQYTEALAQLGFL